jgi:4-hydroxythreonine-4-phosphate dehydrogenase
MDDLQMHKPLIGITMGDPAGIGAEIIVKALSSKQIYSMARPVVIGSEAVIRDALNFIPSPLKLHIVDAPVRVRGEYGTIDLLDLNNIRLDEFHYGTVSASAGRASIEYIFLGIDLTLERKLDAVVTGPIHKEAINAAGFNYAGHTEIFAFRTKTDNYAMMLADGDMRVIHVSTHVSLRNACDMVKKERVLTVLRLAQEALKRLGIEKPRIAIAGLNPHAGEHGLFGDEESNEIIPAIKRALKEGILVEGPLPADTLFSKLAGKQYDIAVVMYHDQGHIPMKLKGFCYDHNSNRWLSMSGVNVTLGLPIIRTSVDHGVAYGKAGEGRANEESMIEAIKMAVHFARHRGKGSQFEEVTGL